MPERADQYVLPFRGEADVVQGSVAQANGIAHAAEGTIDHIARQQLARRVGLQFVGFRREQLQGSLERIRSNAQIVGRENLRQGELMESLAPRPGLI